jgi:hypothetical protein
MNETITNTKSTIVLQSKKYSCASLHNNSETILNSQLLRDSAHREGDSKAILSTPTKGNFQEEKKVNSSKNQLLPKLLKLKLSDWNQILDSKQKEIQKLEESNIEVSKKISQALDYIQENQKTIPALLEEKDQQINFLKEQLNNINQEIAALKLYKKSNSVGYIFDPSELNQRRFTLDQSSQLNRLTSLSPKAKEEKIIKEKYKMYAENPLKKLTNPPLSIKTSKLSYKPIGLNTSQTTRHEKSHHLEFEKNQLKEHLSQPRIKPQSPRPVYTNPDVSSPRLTKIINQKVPEKREIRVNESKKPEKKNMDLAEGFDTLLSKFTSLLDKYQRETKRLTARNKQLERKLQSLMESKSQS